MFLDDGFIKVTEQLIAENGRDALLEPRRAKSLIADYAKSDYKKEAGLLLRAVEAGCAKTIAEVKAADLADCKKALVRRLKGEHFIDEEAAAWVLDLLGLVLRGHKGKTDISEFLPAPTVRESSPGVLTTTQGFEIRDGGEVAPAPSGFFSRLFSRPDRFPSRPAPSPLPPAEQRCAVGDFIWARWSGDRNLYFARIDSAASDYVNVRYYDETPEPVAPENIFYLSEALALGYRVLGDWKLRGSFWDCRILEQKPHTVLIKYDDGTLEDLPYRGLIFFRRDWVAPS